MTQCVLHVETYPKCENGLSICMQDNQILLSGIENIPLRSVLEISILQQQLWRPSEKLGTEDTRLLGICIYYDKIQIE